MHRHDGIDIIPLGPLTERHDQLCACGCVPVLLGPCELVDPPVGGDVE